MKAVIDRFEGEIAVLILGQGDERVDLPRAQLPRGVREGAWLQVEIIDGKIMSVVIDKEETDRAKQRIAEKLAALRSGKHLNKRE